MTGVAWVTGAGKGIGRQVALELAKEGWQVIASVRTKADLDSLVRFAVSLNGSVKAHPADVTIVKMVMQNKCKPYYQIKKTLPLCSNYILAQ